MHHFLLHGWLPVRHLAFDAVVHLSIQAFVAFSFFRSRIEFKATCVAMRNSQVVNFAVGSYVSRRPVNPQKNFLRQLLRYRLVLHHPVQEMHHGSPVPLEQQCEAGFIPFADTQHQLGVAFQSDNSLHIVLNPSFRRRLRYSYSPLSVRSMKSRTASWGDFPEFKTACIC